ncbi:uncharacterized protein LOC127725216 isoform X2 [Mytilus californianus]|uniref:uncharacterized protein LOC127725216 isoform X2 n=1 Tax=Mytilus californianus TaxID=6549 RepID=UPI002245AA0E|nr:uncharacterized protein LOC127725216 isoform X2 [Mytilus californianus]
MLNKMVENLSMLYSGICVFLSITDMQNAQLQTVPNPCLDISAKSTIANMCTTQYAKEEKINGGTTIDSVALRVMTQQDGCTCEVTLQNQTSIYTLFMRKYDMKTNAAPENQECGLAIEIDYNIPNNFPETKDPVECTKGTDARSISLSKNGVLFLRSKIIGGIFKRGYCMQIYRQHNNGDNLSIQMNCSNPNLQATQQTTNLATQYTTASEHSTTQTTQQTTNASIQDTTASDKDSTLYIAISVGSVVVVIALIVVVAIAITRRKVNTNKDNTEVQPDTDCTDYDSDGLKYNTLYNASEQQDIMEGDYHTVDLERKQNRTGIQTFGGDYSAVDGNYSSIDIVNMPVKDGSKTNNKIKSTSTTTDRSETQRTEEETSNNLKHVTPMANSNVEYAVVDNRGTSDKKVKHVTAPNDSNVEYAVIDKKIQI